MCPPSSPHTLLIGINVLDDESLHLRHSPGVSSSVCLDLISQMTVEEFLAVTQPVYVKGSIY